MTQTVAIIDPGSGNLQSVEKAFRHAAGYCSDTYTIAVTSDPDRVRHADRVVLPGVGAFSACMDGLTSQKGLRDALDHAVRTAGKPFLGICVGMHLLATQGLEFGSHAGLGWIPGTVRRIVPAFSGIRVPHMGWNAVRPERGRSLPDPVPDGTSSFYFAHSYHFECDDAAYLHATTDHGETLAAVVGYHNILGVQFHPEKSQHAGIAMIAAFLKWEPV